MIAISRYMFLTYYIHTKTGLGGFRCVCAPGRLFSLSESEVKFMQATTR